MTVFFPSEHISLHWLEVPSAPRRKWKELLPWLLEERLLSPVDKMLCQPLAEHEGSVLVLVVARAQLRAVLDELEGGQEQQGLEAATLVPDYFALPWAENEIAVAGRSDGCWVVRHGLWQGFAAAPALAGMLVEQLLEDRLLHGQSQQGQPQKEQPQKEQPQKEQPQARLRLWLADGDVPAALRARGASVEGRFDWRNPPLVAPALAKAANLRSGEFAPPSQDVLPQWWPTAALLVLGLTLGYAALALDAGRLRAEVALLEARQTLTVERLFPGLNDVPGLNAGSDLRAAVEQRVNGRFLQRQQLDQPVALMLQNLDQLLSNCRCELSALEVQAQGGSLQLPAGSAVEPFRRAALQVSSSSSGVTVAFTPQALAGIAAGSPR